MSKIYFSNYRIEDDTEYFLYVGELKNYGLNQFLKEALSRIYNKKVDFISIVPDVFEQYNYQNIVVLNPNLETYVCQYGPNVSCRVSLNDFAAAVSHNAEVRSLVETLLSRQDGLYVYMFESHTEMTLDEIPGVTILGPDKKIAQRINNKTVQAAGLKDIVPYVDFRICNGLRELLATTDGLWDEWRDGIFVTLEYSAAGVNSIVAHSREDIENKFTQQNATYLITRFVPHDYDPTVLAVAVNENEVYIAGVADQRIENGNRFTGSTFPTVLPPAVVEELKEHTRAAGRWMARQGYRGIFGCDYIVSNGSDIHFLEINARKQGTTLEFCCTLEQLLPKGAPSLPELEFHAVTNGALPDTAIEPNDDGKKIYWGTYNYKLHSNVITSNYIPHSSREREAFAKIGDGHIKKDFLIVEHVGSDFVVAKGSFLARIIALGHDQLSVTQGLQQGRSIIDLTFRQHYEEDGKIHTA